MLVDVIFTHPDFYIFYKPEGVSVQNEGADQGFLAIASNQVGETLFLCHRIDKPTSGLLILARTPHANRVISQSFQNRQINKYYLALSDQKPKKKQGLIVGDMAPARRGAFKLLPTKHNPARTRFFSFSLGQNIRLFVLKPTTGKTHQIRVALKSLGSPIIGDARYAGTHKDRMYLHAFGVEFTYNDENISVFQLPKQGALFKESPFVEEMAKLAVVDLAWKA